MKSIQIILFTALLFAGLFSCKDKGKDVEDYDRVPLLTNIADNLIIPNYQSLQTKMTDLSNKINNLNATPTQTTLDAARASWLDACKQWQYCKAYEFGPAASIALRNSMNTYPTDTVLINSNIASGTYTLGSVGNIQAIGFPALDYLLFFGTDNDIITSITNSANLKQYLLDLVAKMTTDLNYVESEWTSTYRNTFIASTGSAVGSSISDLYNQFIFDLELIKNAKYGIPLGKDVLDVPRPTYVEAYYSGFSNTLAIENMHSIENIFLGRSMAGTDGTGFEEYCDFVGAKRGAEDLSTVIKNQFSLLDTDMAAIPNTLSNAIISNYSQVNDLFFAIKTQVLYTKTDMSSALGLLITFDSNDGD